MSVHRIGDQAQLDNRLSDEKIALYRGYLHKSVKLHDVASAGRGRAFEGVSWEYFLADLELEARAARLALTRDGTVGSFCDTIDVLPPMAILRLIAARTVYFSSLAPENEAQVDWLLQPLDAATATQMRQRRHAVHAVQASEATQKEAREEREAQEEALRSQWRQCPRARLSSEPEDFLRWVKVQGPDTWHEILLAWDYNCGDRDDVLAWILDQPNCDLGTVAQFFFTSALGLADEDPEKLSPLYRRGWLQMKRVADNWQRGHYVRSELKHRVEPYDMKYYDDLVARRQAEGRPLPWTVPGPQERRFGAREPDSSYSYKPGHLRLKFAVWKRHRDRSTCGQDFPRCCEK